jgi:hypothetical protein
VLSNVGGKHIPYAQFTGLDGDFTIVLASDYVFDSDSTFVIQYDYRYVQSGKVSPRHFRELGRVRAAGDSLRMEDDMTVGDYYARLSGTRLTVHGRYDDWVYRK